MQLCRGDDVTLPARFRKPILSDIKYEVNLLSCKATKLWDEHSLEEQVNIIIDCTSLYTCDRMQAERQEGVEFQCKRLIFSLHNERYKHLMLSGKTLN